MQESTIMEYHVLKYNVCMTERKYTASDAYVSMHSLSYHHEDVVWWARLGSQGAVVVVRLLTKAGGKRGPRCPASLQRRRWTCHYPHYDLSPQNESDWGAELRFLKGVTSASLTPFRDRMWAVVVCLLIIQVRSHCAFTNSFQRRNLNSFFFLISYPHIFATLSERAYFICC